MSAGGADAEAARDTLERCGWQVKVAIVMLRAGLDEAQARARLDAVDGSVDRALNGREAIE